VNYQSTEGDTHTETLLADESAVFQQEIDHLNGILLSHQHKRRWFIPQSDIASFADEIARQCQSLRQSQCDSLMESRWKAWA
jgi:peptide deformylase